MQSAALGHAHRDRPRESGKTLWESTLGTTRDQAPFPIWLSLGAPNLGGSIVTAGGLVFIGATTDKFLRGFDARTGEEIWTERLPYTANATPITLSTAARRQAVRRRRRRAVTAGPSRATQ